MQKPQIPPGLQFVSRYRWAILGIAFVSQLSTTLAGQVVPPIAPLLQSELGLSKVEIGVFSSAAFAGSWMVLLIAGYWTERFGVRKVMSLGQAISGGIMLLMGIAGSFVQAVAVMFVVGLTRGLVQPGASKAIMDWFPTKERATAMGVKQTGYPAAGIAMAMTLPALSLALGWRTAIALVGVFIISGGIATVLVYRDPPAQGAVSQQRVSMREGLNYLIRIPKLWVLSAAAVMLVTAQLGLVAYLALYFTEVVLVPSVPDETARIIAAGGFLALLQAGGVIGRVFWGVVSDHLFPGRRMAGMAGIGAIAGFMALVVGFLAPTLPIWGLVVVIFVYGGTALGWNGLFHALIVETSGREHAALGTGLCMSVTQLGTVGGPPLFGLIVDLTGTYQAAWLCLGALSMTGALLAAVFTKTESKTGQEPPPAPLTVPGNH